jgi:tRNA-(ms[2]io[6]A)-hydroxylase
MAMTSSLQNDSPLTGRAAYDPDHILQCPSPEGWLPVALANLDELLIDHAGCEQKAAAAALTLLGKNPEDRVFIETLSNLAQEEMRHFDMVYRVILGRGATLRHLVVDPYIRDLATIIRKGREEALMDRLLFAALVEARSHERFRLLAGGLAAGPERELYEALIPPEAGHAALFVGLAERVAPKAEVRVRLTQVAAHEAAVVQALAAAPTPRIHG